MSPCILLYGKFAKRLYTVISCEPVIGDQSIKDQIFTLLWCLYPLWCPIKSADNGSLPPVSRKQVEIEDHAVLVEVKFPANENADSAQVGLHAKVKVGLRGDLIRQQVGFVEAVTQ